MLPVRAAGVVLALRTALIAGLVMFRVVYYLAPLGTALVMAAASELRPHRRRHERAMLEPRPAHAH